MTTIQIPKSRRGADALRRELPKLTRAQAAMDAALALFASTGLHRIG